MPIVDVQLVAAAGAAPDAGLAQRLADALGRVFGAAPGRVWVRLSTLNAADYAENGPPLPEDDLPAFVSVLHARPPEGEARAAEARAIAAAVGECVARRSARVHVEYAPPGAGRIAFGGTLLG